MFTGSESGKKKKKKKKRDDDDEANTSVMDTSQASIGMSVLHAYLIICRLMTVSTKTEKYVYPLPSVAYKMYMLLTGRVL